MSSIKRWKTLLSSTAAATGDWISLDVRYDNGSDTRALTIALVAGDTITIQATTKDIRGDISKAFLSTLDPEQIVDLTTAVASGPYLVTGPWTYIRAVKVGTAGHARVEGFV